MNRLTVLYDPDCPPCVEARIWLSRQQRLVALEFLAAGAAAARQRFPALGPIRDVTVVDDNGGVYAADDAWLMCLWALARYRGSSRRAGYGEDRVDHHHAA